MKTESNKRKWDRPVLDFIIHDQVWKTEICHYIMEKSGCAMVRVTQEVDDKSLFLISDLFVSEKMRKIGIGRAILHAAINLCKHLEKTGKIRIVTSENSDTFCDNWYKREGFVLEKVEAPIPMDDSEELCWENVYLMEY